MIERAAMPRTHHLLFFSDVYILGGAKPLSNCTDIVYTKYSRSTTFIRFDRCNSNAWIFHSIDLITSFALTCCLIYLNIFIVSVFSPWIHWYWSFLHSFSFTHDLYYSAHSIESDAFKWKTCFRCSKILFISINYEVLVSLEFR